MKSLSIWIACSLISGCSAAPDQPTPAAATTIDAERARTLEIAELAIRIANNRATASERKQYEDYMRGRK